MMKSLPYTIKSVKHLKEGKKLQIPPEVWNTKNFNSILLKNCSDVYEENDIEIWTKKCILPFPKGNLSNTENYRRVTLTSIAAKMYNLMLLSLIQPSIITILRQNQNCFGQGQSAGERILAESIHREEMRQVLLAYKITKKRCYKRHNESRQRKASFLNHKLARMIDSSDALSFSRRFDL